MQAQQVISLNDEQRKTTLSNWFKVLNLEDMKELVAEKHPSFTKEDVRKYNLKIITNFGDYYWVYRGIHKETKKPYFFCIVQATKFVLLNLRACSAYYKLFKDEIDKVNGYDFHARCQVFLCTTFTVAEGMRTHVASDIFPCLYRFMPLPDLYVLIGSKNPDSMYGLAYDYKINTEISTKHSNGLSYASIYDTDVISRMLNANEGDIITHKRILWESGTAYSEIYNRCVKRTSSGLHSILPDGKCFGHMVYEAEVEEEHALIEKDEDLIDAPIKEEGEDDDEDYDSDDIDYEPEKDEDENSEDDDDETDDD